IQRGKPPEWWEKQKGSRGIRRGQWYRLVFQFPIRQVSRYQVAPQPDTIFIFTLLTSQLLLFLLSPVLMVGMQGHTSYQYNE
ncbi:hypothetical protein, partial [Escherichia coli]|uniref:hypothetical protein n=1 Tax=Escherichia coli TaxID=562 RepID=UPI003DA7881E